MRRRQILAQAGEIRPVAPTVSKDAEDRAEYERRFGKPPHHRMKPETIRARLSNGDTGDSRA